MRVYIPSPLRSYTGQASAVDADGATLAEVVAHLDGRYPGIRFRMIDEQDQIRPHIKLFVNQEQERSLGAPVARNDEVHIICALSGG